MKIGFCRRLPVDVEHALAPYFEKVTVYEQSRPLNRAELETVFIENDVVLCALTDCIDSQIIEKYPNLKCLMTFSVGVDHIDLNALKRKKIPLVYTPGALTDATADLTWSLILGCARRLKPAMALLEAGKFAGISPTGFLGLELRDSTLGIIGMGRIGKAVAERAKAFGMKTLSINSKETHELSSLLKDSDVVSIHCPLSVRTKHLIGSRELSLMKRGAILINTARGPIIDEKALLRHLLNSPDFYAGLDVFENEPQIDSGLYSLPNALCLPHIGSATERARKAMAQICVDDAIRFAKGEPLLYEYKT